MGRKKKDGHSICMALKLYREYWNEEEDYQQGKGEGGELRKVAI